MFQHTRKFVLCGSLALVIFSSATAANELPVESKVESKSESATTKASDAITLGKIETEVENEMTLVTAKLSGLPSWKNLEIEDHGTFVQAKLLNVSVANSGEFLDGNGPFLKKIALFQLNEQDSAIRFFVNQDAAKAKLASTIELVGERVVFSLDHKKLEQLIQPQKKDVAEKALASESMAATAKVEATAAKTQPGTEPSAEKNESLNLRDKLITATAFCAFMLVLLGFSTVWKKKRLKQKKDQSTFGKVDPVPMKFLSHLSVSSRQRLSLVQVGSKQVLIGISPDNISMITEIHEAARPSFSNQLLSADPNAPVKLKNTEQRPVPQSKNEISSKLTQALVKPKTVGPAKTPTLGQRINAAVGDDGIKDARTKAAKIDKNHTDQSFDDITKLIRDRLKNLPPAP